MRLFVGDDWAQDHHDVEVMDEAGRVLATARLPEGVAGMARLHELARRYLGGHATEAEVAVGIETDRGPWVAALVAAGYVVYAVNPLQASRYRERHGVSGAKSDADATWLAQLGAHGLVRSSFVPPEPIRQLRDLTRARTAITRERSREAQRLEKLLEDAGIKLSAVASDILSVGGHAHHRRVTAPCGPDVVRHAVRRLLVAAPEDPVSLDQEASTSVRPETTFTVSADRDGDGAGDRPAGIAARPESPPSHAGGPVRRGAPATTPGPLASFLRALR